MKHSIHLDIGARVREHRKRVGMSLDALSRASGVSKAMLSQIEQNKANPTVAVVCKIGNGLGIDLAELMGLSRLHRHFEVIRADDPRQIFTSSKMVTVRTLSPLSMEKDLEFYEVVLGRGGKLESAPHFQHTEEYLTVSQGRVTLTCAGEEVGLRNGDSVHYSADVAHSIANAARGVARVYLVVLYRTEGRGTRG